MVDRIPLYARSLLAVGALLFIVVLPLSFQYVEYYEYGLKQRKTTGSVDTSKVYGRGRYFLGPDARLIKYKADAHMVSLKDLVVFSSGTSEESIGLTFSVDIDFTYLLIKEEVGLLHRELAGTYEITVKSKATEAIRNEAIKVPFEDYFQNRRSVEQKFRTAVLNRWQEKPSLHVYLDQFFLGHVRIAEVVAKKQLEHRIQNEKNIMESFVQQARIERELTDVEINTINLEKDFLTRTAKAEANLTRAKANLNADRILAKANRNGTLTLFEAAGITSQDHRMSFSYIRTLKNHKNIELDVTFLSSENIVRTTDSSS